MKSPHEEGIGESLPSKIRGLLPARSAQMPEKRTAAFRNSVVGEVKRAVLRECWLHIWFCFNVTGRSWVCARRAGIFSGRFTTDTAAHRGAPLFEVGDLSTEKGDADVGGR